jgi:ribonucleoside-diphosphate reductase alpha chain
MSGSTTDSDKFIYSECIAMELSAHQQTVWEDRYALKDKSGNRVEDKIEQTWARAADAIGDSEDEKSDFYLLLKDFKFVPGGRIMAGAGAGTEQTFYNCYVIPVEPKPSTRAYSPEVGNDSREAIFDTTATMVDIMSRGGGVGINWSVLRPSGSYLSRVSGTSSGPVGWMDVASKAVGEVEQGGSRRGAAMFMLDDWHPDLLKFIEAKRDYTKITNANVSVGVSDEFMHAVENNLDWTFRFPDTRHGEYNSSWDGNLQGWIDRGLPVRDYATYPARTIWERIVASAHASGEPGLVFLGRYNRLSTGAHAERIISVNPCGEQGLGAYSVCNLGSMNLAAYATGDTERAGFDWIDFERDVRTATRFLDNVIDKSYYWDERSRERQADLRRIGLGVMGLADALVYLGIRYGSPEAVEFTERVFRTMKDAAIEESMVLAEEKGPAGAYESSVWKRPYLAEYRERNSYTDHSVTGAVITRPLRNLFFLTQAPTGTTSIVAGVNSGIEPFFALGYWRTDRTGKHWVQPTALDGIVREDAYPPEYVVTANEVTVEEHIAMQAAVQKYVDSSVSKTINGPNSHTVEDVDKAYRLAYAQGLKGLAYFRDGSGRAQVLSTEATTTVVDHREEDRLKGIIEELENRNKELEEQAFVGPSGSEFRRPDVMTGETYLLNTSMGHAYLTVNRDGTTRQPIEVFVNVGKAGSDVMALGEAIGRLISISLQNGTPVEKISKQLVGVGGTAVFNQGLVHAIGKKLEDVADLLPPEIPTVRAGEITISGDLTPAGVAYFGGFSPAPEPAKFTGSLCPDCQNMSVAREEGCQKCHSCGWSAC